LRAVGPKKTAGIAADGELFSSPGKLKEIGWLFAASATKPVI
jgi:hypothetical protein